MDKYAPKFSKVLVTPDPHYIPGYAGYCPQLKYHIGKTYAKQTAELLTNPEVKHSKHLLIYKGRVPSSESALTPIPDSDSKKTIPGYTGFIPKRQDYFGCSYAETCRKALSDSYHEERSRIQRQSAKLPIVANDINRQFERTKLPLTPINKTFSYKSLKSFTPLGKPYCMDDDDPQKYFISGFAGHVPKTRFLIGKGYPIMTNQALIQFGKQQRSDPTSLTMPGRKDSTITPMPRIYPSKMGVVAAFTGHIPGYKFMYGQTFGKLTRNALDEWQRQNPSSKVINPSNTSIK